MALKFKIAQRTIALGKRKGQTVHYAIQEEHPRTSWSSVEERIIKGTGISRADLRAVVIALSDIIEEELKEGRAVDLADLGSIKVTASGKMMDTAKQVTAATVSKPRIQFYVRSHLREVTDKIGIEVLKEIHIPKPKKGSKDSGPSSDASPSAKPSGSEEAGRNDGGPGYSGL